MSDFYLLSLPDGQSMPIRFPNVQVALTYDGLTYHVILKDGNKYVFPEMEAFFKFLMAYQHWKLES